LDGFETIKSINQLICAGLNAIGKKRSATAAKAAAMDVD